MCGHCEHLCSTRGIHFWDECFLSDECERYNVTASERCNYNNTNRQTTIQFAAFSALNFSVNDIEKLYSIAQGLHIHTVVIATKAPITTTNSIYRKIREYGIDVWDLPKLTVLATAQTSSETPNSYSVLKTSDTSDDHCKIDPSSFDPIQDERAAKTNSLFSGLFSKPDRL